MFPGAWDGGLLDRPRVRPRVFDDPWPEEPDDPFSTPTDQFDLEIPSSADVPKELWRAFWGLVAVFNVAIFALALGPLLVVFRGEVVYGGIITGIGIVSFLYGVYRYRRYREAELS